MYVVLPFVASFLSYRLNVCDIAKATYPSISGVDLSSSMARWRSLAAELECSESITTRTSSKPKCVIVISDVFIHQVKHLTGRL